MTEEFKYNAYQIRSSQSQKKTLNQNLHLNHVVPKFLIYVSKRPPVSVEFDPNHLLSLVKVFSRFLYNIIK